MLVKFYKFKLGQRGDTLVEVLISILIVSMVLTGAYVTTNRSSMGIRDAQEHAEALKLIQGQLEQIRQNAAQADPPVFDQPDNTPFCLVDTIVNNGASCRRTGSDQAAGSGDLAYELSIRRTDCAPQYTSPSASRPCHKFTVQARWDSIVSENQAFEQIVTRLYK